MRASLIGLALALLGVACFDFGLESRRFRCEPEGATCGTGQVCGPDGYCAAEADAAAGEQCTNGNDDDGDDLIDCLDPDCGPSPCDDDNPCTGDACNSDGSCSNVPIGGGMSCGAGCTCSAGGIQQEEACGDFADNDSDSTTDCNDSDCPTCADQLTCCPDGGCRVGCE